MRDFGNIRRCQARPAVAGLLWLGLAFLAASAAAQLPPAVQQLQRALRSLPGEVAQQVTLPDTLNRDGAEDATPLQPSYRLGVELGAAPGRTAVYLPGVFAPVRVAVNGHTVADRIREPSPRPPRGADRLLLAPVPAEFLRPGLNQIEVSLAGRHRTSLSRVWVGDEDTLRGLYQRKVLLTVHGPVAAAAVIMALSLCVLLLWARRTGDTLYAYFGIGGLLWALHTVWTVLPNPILKPPHFSIWWTMGFPLFCAPLVVFCVRLARWQLPRFERALWVGVAVGPVLLYGAHFAGVLDTAQDFWRLAWLVAVAVGVFAVGRYALQQRNAQGVLLLATGALALVFGARDWLLDQDRSDNHPVFLTSYSGLLFFPLVAWILIDSFVRTARELRELNIELERRVADKSTELSQALNEMRAAKDAAETADRAKSSFLAAASHDLRQPAHALGLYLAALRGETLNAAQLELVERMSAATSALDTMFNALLDISRMDAGAVQVRPRPFELAPMLHRLAAEFSQQAADKGLRLSVRISSAARQWRAHSDPMLVERIVRNLLGNAIKYTREGGVLLACRRCGGAVPAWQIQVWDTGQGIAAADRERVFEEFFQLDPSGRGQVGAADRGSGHGLDGSARLGLGLGLSIVRRLAQLLGHGVSLRSTPGRGTCLTLELPATAADALVEMRASHETRSLAGLRVGVIDDEDEVREGMRVLLERWGCVVTTGASAEELLARAAGGVGAPPQVLVVDYQLREGRTGVEAIEAVRRACRARPPALIVSGVSAATRLAELHASGFEWLIKPVPPERLRNWLVAATQKRCGSAGTPTRREATSAARP